jgi:hypothetical protein
MKRALTVGSVLALAATLTHADTIQFAGLEENLSSPTAEGIFTYNVFSGGLFRSGSDGNPAPDIQGGVDAGGGILKIVRNDVSGGLFTFDSADIGAFAFFAPIGPVPAAPTQIEFEGFKLGVSQGVDQFTTSGLPWSTENSAVLQNKEIDELRVTLDADVVFIPVVPIPLGFDGEEVDNIVLTSKGVSAPDAGSTLNLFLAGVASLCCLRRARKS